MLKIHPDFRVECESLDALMAAVTGNLSVDARKIAQRVKWLGTSESEALKTKLK